MIELIGRTGSRHRQRIHLSQAPRPVPLIVQAVTLNHLNKRPFVERERGEAHSLSWWLSNLSGIHIECIHLPVKAFRFRLHAFGLTQAQTGPLNSLSLCQWSTLVRSSSTWRLLKFYTGIGLLNNCVPCQGNAIKVPSLGIFRQSLLQPLGNGFDSFGNGGLKKRLSWMKSERRKLGFGAKALSSLVFCSFMCQLIIPNGK